MTSNCVLILGMHRSGTSCLAGCLEAGGLFLGHVNTAAAFNKKGNRESPALMSLHNRILATAGASWDDPPRTALDWPADLLKELREYADQFGSIHLWGAKDPRALFLLTGWEQVCRPRYVGTFRHPNSVAASLQRRAKAWNAEMTYEKAVSIWMAYNTQLLQTYQQHAFPIIRYDQSPNLYRSRLQQICAALDLAADPAFDFYSGQLQTHECSAEAMSHSAEPIWEQLLETERASADLFA